MSETGDPRRQGDIPQASNRQSSDSGDVSSSEAVESAETSVQRTSNPQAKKAIPLRELSRATNDLNQEEIKRLQSEVAASEERFGKTRIQTLELMVLLAAQLLVLKNYTTARDTLQEAYRRSSETHGKEHTMTLQLSTALSEVLTELGELDKSTKLLEDVLHALRKKHGPDHEEVINLSLTLSGNYVLLKRYQEAEKCLKVIRSKAKALWGESDNRYQSLEHSLVKIYQQLNRKPSKSMLKREAIDIDLLRETLIKEQNELTENTKTYGMPEDFLDSMKQKAPSESVRMVDTEVDENKFKEIEFKDPATASSLQVQWRIENQVSMDENWPDKEWKSDLELALMTDRSKSGAQEKATDTAAQPIVTYDLAKFKIDPIQRPVPWYKDFQYSQSPLFYNGTDGSNVQNFVKSFKAKYESALSDIRQQLPSLTHDSLPDLDSTLNATFQRNLQLIWQLSAANRKFANQCQSFSTSFAVSLSDEFITTVNAHVAVVREMLTSGGIVTDLANLYDEWVYQTKLIVVFDKSWDEWKQVPTPVYGHSVEAEYGSQADAIRALLKSIDDDITRIVAVNDGSLTSYLATMKDAFKNKDLLFSHVNATEPDIDGIARPFIERSSFPHGPSIDKNKSIFFQITQLQDFAEKVKKRMTSVRVKITNLLEVILSEISGSKTTKGKARFGSLAKKSVAIDESKIREDRHVKAAASMKDLLSSASNTTLLQVEQMSVLQTQLDSFCETQSAKLDPRSAFEEMLKTREKVCMYFLKEAMADEARKLETIVGAAVGRPLLTNAFLDFWKVAGSDSTKAAGGKCFEILYRLDELVEAAVTPDLQPLINIRRDVIEIVSRLSHADAELSTKLNDPTHLQLPEFRPPQRILAKLDEKAPKTLLEQAVEIGPRGALTGKDFNPTALDHIRGKCQVFTDQATVLVEQLFELGKFDVNTAGMQEVRPSDLKFLEEKRKKKKKLLGTVKDGESGHASLLAVKFNADELLSGPIINLGHLSPIAVKTALSSASDLLLHHLASYCQSYAKMIEEVRELIFLIEKIPEDDIPRYKHKYSDTYRSLLRERIPEISRYQKAFAYRRLHSVFFFEFWVASPLQTNATPESKKLAQKIFNYSLLFEEYLRSVFLPDVKPLSILWSYLTWKFSHSSLHRPFLNNVLGRAALRPESLTLGQFIYTTYSPEDVAAAVLANREKKLTVNKSIVTIFIDPLLAGGSSTLCKSGFSPKAVEDYCIALLDDVDNLVRQTSSTYPLTPHFQLFTTTMKSNAATVTSNIYTFADSSRQLAAFCDSSLQALRDILKDASRVFLNRLHQVGQSVTQEQVESLNALNKASMIVNGKHALSHILMEEAFNPKRSLVGPKASAETRRRRLEAIEKLFVALQAIDKELVTRSKPSLRAMKSIKARKSQILTKYDKLFEIAQLERPDSKSWQEIVLPKFENAFWHAKAQVIPTIDNFKTWVLESSTLSGEVSSITTIAEEEPDGESTRGESFDEIRKSLLMVPTELEFDNLIDTFKSRFDHAVDVIDRWIELDTLETRLESALAEELSQPHNTAREESSDVHATAESVAAAMPAGADLSSAASIAAAPVTKSKRLSFGFKRDSSEAPTGEDKTVSRSKRLSFAFKTPEEKTRIALTKHVEGLEKIKSALKAAWNDAEEDIRQLRQAQLMFIKSCDAVVRDVDNILQSYIETAAESISDIADKAEESTLRTLVDASQHIRVGTMLAQSFLDYWYNNEDTRLLTESRDLYKQLRRLDERLTNDIRPDLRSFMRLRLSILNAAAYLLTDKSPIIRKLQLRLERLYYPLNVRFTFLPLPPESLSSGTTDSYVVREKYSEESVALVHVKVHRQYAIAQEWLKQFADLIGPKRVTGVAPSDFSKLAKDLDAAMRSFDEEMMQYIRVNTDFASDCQDSVNEFLDEWNTSESNADAYNLRRTAFVRLVEFYKVLLTDKIQNVAKVGNAFMSSSQFAKNRSQFYKLYSSLSTKYPLALQKVRRASSLASTFDQAFDIGKSIALGKLLEYLPEQSDVDASNDIGELFESAITSAKGEAVNRHRVISETLEKMAVSILDALKQSEDDINSFVPFSFGAMYVWNDMSTSRREKIGREPLLLAFDRLTRLDHFVRSQVFVSKHPLAESIEVLKKCGEGDSIGKVVIEISKGDVDPACPPSRQREPVEGGPFEVEIPSAKAIASKMPPPRGTRLSLPLSREGLMTNNFGKLDGESKESFGRSLAEHSFSPNAVKAFKDAVASHVTDVVKTFNNIPKIDSKELVALVSHFSACQLRLIGIVDTLAAAFGLVTSATSENPSWRSGLNAFMASRQILRRILIEKFSWFEQMRHLSDIKNTLEDVDSRVPADMAKSIDLDKMKYARNCVNDTIDPGPRQIPNLKSEKVDWNFGKCEWSLDNLKEMRDEARESGVAVEAVEPLIDASKRNVLLREMEDHEKEFSKVLSDLAVKYQSIDRRAGDTSALLRLKREETVEAIEGLLTEGIAEYQRAVVDSPDSPIAKLQRTADAFAGSGRTLASLEFLKIAADVPAPDKKRIYDTLADIDAAISQIALPSLSCFTRFRSIAANCEYSVFKVRGAELRPVTFILALTSRPALAQAFDAGQTEVAGVGIDVTKLLGGHVTFASFSEEAVKELSSSVRDAVKKLIASSRLSGPSQQKLIDTVTAAVSSSLDNLTAFASVYRSVASKLDVISNSVSALLVQSTNEYDAIVRSVADQFNSTIVDNCDDIVRGVNSCALRYSFSQKLFSLWRRYGKAIGTKYDESVKEIFERLAKSDQDLFGMLLPSFASALAIRDEIEACGYAARNWSKFALVPTRNSKLWEACIQDGTSPHDYPYKVANPAKGDDSRHFSIMKMNVSQVLKQQLSSLSKVGHDADEVDLFDWSTTAPAARAPVVVGRVKLLIEIDRSKSNGMWTLGIVVLKSEKLINRKDFSRGSFVRLKLGWQMSQTPTIDGELPDYIDTISNKDGKFKFEFSDSGYPVLIIECYEEGGVSDDLLLGSLRIQLSDLKDMFNHTEQFIANLDRSTVDTFEEFVDQLAQDMDLNTALTISLRRAVGSAKLDLKTLIKRFEADVADLEDETASPVYSEDEKLEQLAWLAMLRAREQTLENLRDIERVAEQIYSPDDEKSVQDRMVQAMVMHAIGMFGFTRFEGAPVNILEGWFALQDTADASTLYSSHWDLGSETIYLESLRREVQSAISRIPPSFNAQVEALESSLVELCDAIHEIGEVQRGFGYECEDLVQSVDAGQKLSFSMAFGKFWSMTQYVYDWYRDMIKDVADFKEYRNFGRVTNASTQSAPILSQFIDYTSLLKSGASYLQRKVRFAERMHEQISSTIESMFAALQACDRSIAQEFVPVVTAIRYVHRIISQHAKDYPDVFVPEDSVTLQVPKILTVESFLNSFVRNQYEKKISLGTSITGDASITMLKTVIGTLVNPFEETCDKLFHEHSNTDPKKRLGIETITDYVVSQGVNETTLIPKMVEAFGDEFLKTQRKNARQSLLVDYPHLRKIMYHEHIAHLEQIVDGLSQPGGEAYLPDPVPENETKLVTEWSGEFPALSEITEDWPAVVEQVAKEDLRKSDLISEIALDIWMKLGAAARELRIQIGAMHSEDDLITEYIFKPVMVIFGMFKQFGDDMVYSDNVRDADFVAKLFSVLGDDPFVIACVRTMAQVRFRVATISYKLQDGDYETTRVLIRGFLDILVQEMAKHMNPSPIDDKTRRKLERLANSALHTLELFDSISDDESLCFAKLFRSALELLGGGVTKKVVIESLSEMAKTFEISDAIDVTKRAAFLFDIAEALLDLKNAQTASSSRLLLQSLADLFATYPNEISALGGTMRAVATLEALKLAQSHRIRDSMFENLDPIALFSAVLDENEDLLNNTIEAFESSDASASLEGVLDILQSILVRDGAEVYVILKQTAAFILWIVELLDRFNDIKESEFVTFDLPSLEDAMRVISLKTPQFLKLSHRALQMALGEQAITIFDEYLSTIYAEGAKNISTGSFQTLKQLVLAFESIIVSNPYETRFDIKPLFDIIRDEATSLEAAEDILDSLNRRFIMRQYCSFGQLLQEVYVSEGSTNYESAAEALRCLSMMIELFGNTRGTSETHQPNMSACLHLSLRLSRFPAIAKLCEFTIGNEIPVDHTALFGDNINDSSKEAWEEHSLLEANASAATYKLLLIGSHLSQFVDSLGRRRVVLSLVHYSLMYYHMRSTSAGVLYGCFGDEPNEFFTKNEHGASGLTDFIDIYLDPASLELAADILEYQDSVIETGKFIKVGEVSEAVEEIVGIVGELGNKYVYLRVGAVEDIRQIFEAKYPIVEAYANASFDVFEMRRFIGNTLLTCLPEQNVPNRTALLDRWVKEALGIVIPQSNAIKVSFEVDPATIIRFVRRFAITFKRHSLLSFDIMKLEHIAAMKDEMMSRYKKVAFSKDGGFNQALYPSLVDRVMEYLRADVKDDVIKMLDKFTFPLFHVLFERAQEFTQSDLTAMKKRAFSLATRQWESVLNDLIRRIDLREDAQFGILEIRNVLESAESMINLAMAETEKLSSALRDDAPRLAGVARTLAQAILRLEWTVESGVGKPRDVWECIGGFAKMADPQVVEFLQEPVRFASSVVFLKKIQLAAVRAINTEYSKTRAALSKEAICREVWKQVSTNLSENVDLFFDDGFYVPGFFNRVFLPLMNRVVAIATRVFVIKGANLGMPVAWYGDSE